MVHGFFHQDENPRYFPWITTVSIPLWMTLALLTLYFTLTTDDERSWCDDLQGVFYQWTPPIFSMFWGHRNSGIFHHGSEWCELPTLVWCHFWQLKRDKIDEQWLDHSLFFVCDNYQGRNKNTEITELHTSSNQDFPKRTCNFNFVDEVQTTSQIWEGVQGDGQGRCVKNPRTPSDSGRFWSLSEISEKKNTRSR